MQGIYLIISCGFMWIFRAKKYKILAPTQLFVVVVFYKLNPIQNTTNTTQITENSLKLSTSHIKIQIGENLSPIVYSIKSTKSGTSQISHYCFNTESSSHMHRATK